MVLQTVSVSIPFTFSIQKQDYLRCTVAFSNQTRLSSYSPSGNDGG